MSRLGVVNSNQEVNLVTDQDFSEVTGQSTTAAALENIAGNSFQLTIPTGRTGRILATLTVQTSTTGGAPATGGWAIQINSVDGGEIQRYLSGTNDSGALAVQARSASLTPGNYTVQGRHRRVSGTSTVNTDRAQLAAIAVIE